LKKIFLIIIIASLFVRIYPENIELTKDDKKNELKTPSQKSSEVKVDKTLVMLYMIKYFGNKTSEEAISIERNITDRVKTSLNKTGRFEVINTVISEEALAEIKSTQLGLTENKEKINSKFSNYIVTGKYIDLDGKAFISLSLIDMANGKIINSAFDQTESNVKNIYDACSGIAFNLAGLNYKKTEIVTDQVEDKNLISGFTVSIIPGKGDVKSVLMTPKKDYAFYGSKIKLPPLSAGEYKLSIEKNGFYPVVESIYIVDDEKKNIDIYLENKKGKISINTPNEINSRAALDDKNQKSDFEKYLIFKDVLIGKHFLYLEKDLYFPQKLEVELFESGESVNLNVDFKVKPVNTLFTSNVKATSVFVDGIFYGITPFVRKIGDGTHNITFKKFLYGSYASKIDIYDPEPQIVKGTINADLNKVKLLREFYPHFFLSLNLYGGLYSPYFLRYAPFQKIITDKNAGEALFNISTDISFGLDLEYLFFGVKTLLTWYNENPYWINTINPSSLNLDLIPYIGFKLYAGLYTSFDIGLGLDMTILKATPGLKYVDYPIARLNVDLFTHFQNYLLLFNITFYNKYKREVFGFISMTRFDFLDRAVYPNATGFNHPLMVYLGLKIPIVYTDSKKRMESKSYQYFLDRENDVGSYEYLLDKKQKNQQ
jgi:TolB-like protein